MSEPDKFQILDRATYRRRVFGCWLGKAIGGTLGQPHEGHAGELNLSFYDPVPDGVVPNDDLDLQVMALEAVRRHGPDLSRLDLAAAWIEHVDFPWDEYGSALANLRRGILPPLSGSHANYCGDCMGSPIRSEVWAVLAPGDPELACALAYEDAVIDHDGEGVWGELFLAAIESAAFVVHDRDRLIELGLSAIPPDCRIARAVRSTLDWFARDPDWHTVRRRILEQFGHHNFTDAPQNLAFIVLGWLAGKDFGDAICTAVNCGQDTDCTGATLGALLGILSPDDIPQRWRRPVGQEIVLSPGVKNLDHPATIGELAERTARLAEDMLNARSARVRLGEQPASGAGVAAFSDWRSILRRWPKAAAVTRSSWLSGAGIGGAS
jgi:ADP-ribosylglycohydrolase